MRFRNTCESGPIEPAGKQSEDMRPVATSALRVFLDLSTEHLTRETQEWLDERAHRSVVCSLGLRRWVAPTPCGWFVHADANATDDDVPDDLRTCMKAAREIGAEFILFDGETPLSGEACSLPIYGDASA